MFFTIILVLKESELDMNHVLSSLLEMGDSITDEEELVNEFYLKYSKENVLTTLLGLI